MVLTHGSFGMRGLRWHPLDCLSMPLITGQYAVYMNRSQRINNFN